MKKILNWIGAVVVMGGITIACFIPVILFIVAYYLLSPNGFWQKFVVFGVGVWFLGVFQLIGLILCIAFWLYVTGVAK